MCKWKLEYISQYFFDSTLAEIRKKLRARDHKSQGYLKENVERV